MGLFDIKKDTPIIRLSQTLLNDMDTLLNKDKKGANDTDILFFIQERYEKVCQAAFAITTVIKETESVRSGIRDTAINLRLRLHMPGIDPVALAETSRTDTGTICGLLDLAKAGGLVSLMNYEYFVSECQKIIDAVSAKIADTHWRFDEVFMLDAGSQKNAQASPKVKQFNPQPRNQAEAIKKDTNQVRDIKDNRNDKIVSYITSHGRVNIQDLHAAMPEISSKTIQRALNVLIAEGKIKRFGDKRWALYYI